MKDLTEPESKTLLEYVAANFSTRDAGGRPVPFRIPIAACPGP